MKSSVIKKAYSIAGLIMLIGNLVLMNVKIPFTFDPRLLPFFAGFNAGMLMGVTTFAIISRFSSQPTKQISASL